MQNYFAYFESPIGMLELISTENALVHLKFVEEAPSQFFEPHPFLQECLDQLDDYFMGHREKFDIPLHLVGTDFQKLVWRELVKIPFGETRTYAEVARKIGKAKAVRAVGNANNKNKIAIMIPCHRIVGADGKLTGYAGGLWRKEWLLNHELTFSFQ